MKTITRKYFKKAVKLSVLAGLAMSLSGCIVALPPAIQMASLALDGVSYATTGKSVTDHAISTVTAQDCAMGRVLQGEDICIAQKVEIAMLPDGTPAPHATDAARAIKTAEHDEAFQSFSANQAATGNEDSDEVLDLSISEQLDLATASGPML